jgi:hypothetical protein
VSAYLDPARFSYRQSQPLVVVLHQPGIPATISRHPETWISDFTPCAFAQFAFWDLVQPILSSEQDKNIADLHPTSSPLENNAETAGL